MQYKHDLLIGVVTVRLLDGLIGTLVSCNDYNEGYSFQVKGENSPRHIRAVKLQEVEDEPHVLEHLVWGEREEEIL